eukprot:TRINITY_DN2495_c0_g1_i1.p1 TRINITY_DN2495_c0_g1~~TRINITY_DN2495_c0_g1_i1.p1  ORF type:complete len:393 (-),score=204.80 TRINITY_DN2495_c0_g1_i1:122-1273(-)
MMKKMRRVKLLLLAMVAAAAVSRVAGHGQMTFPKPRNTNNNIRVFPCGDTNDAKNAKKTEPSVTWYHGDKVDVKWKIDADHGGTVRLGLVWDGQDETQTNFDNGELAKDIGRKAEKYELTVPSTSTCKACTFGWHWTPNPQQESKGYFGCSTVAILSRDGDTKMDVVISDTGKTADDVKAALVASSTAFTDDNVKVGAPVQESDGTWKFVVTVSDLVDKKAASAVKEFVGDEASSKSALSNNGLTVARLSTDDGNNNGPGAGGNHAGGVVAFVVCWVLAMGAFAGVVVWTKKNRPKLYSKWFTYSKPGSARRLEGIQEDEQQQQQQGNKYDPELSRAVEGYGGEGVDAEGGALPPTWEMYYTDDGIPYYYNSVNGLTQWEKPN